MTSFTRKLYARDPAAAMAFYRQSKHDRIMSEHPASPITLAGEHHASRFPAAPRTFGTRPQPPLPDVRDDALEAEFLRDKRWAVRPKGALGTCGWIDGKAWSVRFVTASCAEHAVALAEKAGGCF